MTLQWFQLSSQTRAYTLQCNTSSFVPFAILHWLHDWRYKNLALFDVSVVVTDAGCTISDKCIQIHRLLATAMSNCLSLFILESCIQVQASLRVGAQIHPRTASISYTPQQLTTWKCHPISFYWIHESHHPYHSSSSTNPTLDSSITAYPIPIQYSTKFKLWKHNSTCAFIFITKHFRNIPMLSLSPNQSRTKSKITSHPLT